MIWWFSLLEPLKIKVIRKKKIWLNNQIAKANLICLIWKRNGLQSLLVYTLVKNCTSINAMTHECMMHGVNCYCCVIKTLIFLHHHMCSDWRKISRKNQNQQYINKTCFYILVFITEKKKMTQIFKLIILYTHPMFVP